MTSQWRYTVRLPSWSQAPLNDGETAVFYQLEVTVIPPEGPPRRRSVGRRYSNFLTLHKRLVGEVGEKVMEQWEPPPRRALSSVNRKPELIEQRRWELEQWLWQLTKVPQIANSTTMFHFCELNTASRGSGSRPPLSQASSGQMDLASTSPSASLALSETGSYAAEASRREQQIRHRAPSYSESVGSMEDLSPRQPSSSADAVVNATLSSLNIGTSAAQGAQFVLPIAHRSALRDVLHDLGEQLIRAEEDLVDAAKNIQADQLTMQALTENFAAGRESTAARSEEELRQARQRIEELQEALGAAEEASPAPSASNALFLQRETQWQEEREALEKSYETRCSELADRIKAMEREAEAIQKEVGAAQHESKRVNSELEATKCELEAMKSEPKASRERVSSPTATRAREVSSSATRLVYEREQLTEEHHRALENQRKVHEEALAELRLQMERNSPPLELADALARDAASRAACEALRAQLADQSAQREALEASNAASAHKAREDMKTLAREVKNLRQQVEEGRRAAVAEEEWQRHAEELSSSLEAYLLRQAGKEPSSAALAELEASVCGAGFPATPAPWQALCQNLLALVREGRRAKAHAAQIVDSAISLSARLEGLELRATTPATSPRNVAMPAQTQAEEPSLSALANGTGSLI